MYKAVLFVKDAGQPDPVEALLKVSLLAILWFILNV